MATYPCANTGKTARQVHNLARAEGDECRTCKEATIAWLVSLDLPVPARYVKYLLEDRTAERLSHIQEVNEVASDYASVAADADEAWARLEERAYAQ